MINTIANRKFLEFIREKELIKSDGKILLAVSGGIDSVLMAKLFYRNNLPFDIAHINFKLRGSESDGDEAFVKELARSYKVKFFTKSYDTRQYASDKKISIEMAARDLRNEWMLELKNEGNYKAVALGHHKSDHLETVLMNLIKGTSISGLRGIMPVSGIYIRPMLFATRTEIEQYAKAYALEWRTDSSNTDLNIQRNLIRSKIVPLLKEINPSVESSVYENTYYLSLIEDFLKEKLQSLQSQIILQEGTTIKINIPKLLSSGAAELFLFEFLKPYRFNSRIIRKINQNLNGGSGKIYDSEKHELLIDREYLILSEKTPFDNSNSLIIKEPGHYHFEGREIRVEIIGQSGVKDLKDPAVAYLDKDKIEFPLTIRYWRDGDYFYPFGMNKTKKLSDFFIDEKVPLTSKRRTLVVETANKLCWIVGMRIDNRYRIDSLTKTIIKIASVSDNL
jgi:tRNA(Ile)-lysidine synthase